MKIIDVIELIGTSRQVECPKGGFTSFRLLLEKDGQGFTMTKTVIPPGDWQHWHYKHHSEACFCIKGFGQLKNIETGEISFIYPGVMYAPEQDKHAFMAIDEIELVCVFNPPLKGNEVHQKDGSYGI